MNDTRLVYSTQTGRVCPDCRKPVSACRCKQKKTSKFPPKTHPRDGVVRIQREAKGRKGKTATVIYGLPLDEQGLKDLARELKARCGTGGTAKDGVIVIQGDHRKTLLEAIGEKRYTVKLAGG
jgi:translation initiation factor 1